MLKRMLVIVIAVMMAMILATGCSLGRSTKTQTESQQQHIKIDMPDEDTDGGTMVEDKESEGKEAKESTEGETDKVARPNIPGLEDSIFDEDSKDYEGLKEPEGPSGSQKESETTGNGGSAVTPPQQSDTGTSDSDAMDYETFQNMSPSKQQEYMATFDDIDAFFDWYYAEKERYEAENPAIEIDGGSVNLGDIINRN